MALLDLMVLMEPILFLNCIFQQEIQVELVHLDLKEQLTDLGKPIIRDKYIIISRDLDVVEMIKIEDIFGK